MKYDIEVFLASNSDTTPAIFEQRNRTPTIGNWLPLALSLDPLCHLGNPGEKPVQSWRNSSMRAWIFNGQPDMVVLPWCFWSQPSGIRVRSQKQLSGSLHEMMCILQHRCLSDLVSCEVVLCKLPAIRSSMRTSSDTLIVEKRISTPLSSRYISFL